MKIRMNFLRFFTPSLIFFLCFNTFAQDDSLRTMGPKSGTLLIVGGNASNSVFMPIFADLVGGYELPIVVIPTAGSDEFIEKDPDFEALRNGFKTAGFSNVTILHTRNRDVANSPEFYNTITQAKGIWFAGGRQWRLADSYLNTKTHMAIRSLLQDGGVVAGSSAGATIQGSFLARGDTKKNTIMDGDHKEGLSLITNCAIDQHLLARNRHFDLFEILDNHPHLLGIGLDENTGIVVKGNTFEVVGESYIAIYDGTRWSAERDTTYILKNNRTEFYFLKPGDQYDVYNREVITPEEEE